MYKCTYIIDGDTIIVDPGNKKVRLLGIDTPEKGDKIVIVDDLLATGGTMKAVCSLTEKLGGEVIGISTVVDLEFLPWREKLTGYNVNYLISYDSE